MRVPPLTCHWVRILHHPVRDMGFRQLLIDNYSVIYVVEDDCVTVLRVLYSSSDIIARMQNE